MNSSFDLLERRETLVITDATPATIALLSQVLIKRLDFLASDFFPGR